MNCSPIQELCVTCSKYAVRWMIDPVSDRLQGRCFHCRPAEIWEGGYPNRKYAPQGQMPEGLIDSWKMPEGLIDSWKTPEGLIDSWKMPEGLIDSWMGRIISGLELLDDPEVQAASRAPVCECGAEKCRTTHSAWCPKGDK